MRAQRSFRPSLDVTLEDRVALSAIAPVALRNAAFTAHINPTLHTNFSPPRASNGISIHTTSSPTAPAIGSVRVPSGTAGLNLSTTHNPSIAGAGTGLTSGTNLNSLLNNGLSAVNTAGGLLGNVGATNLGSVLSTVGTGLTSGTNLGSSLSTNGVNSLSSLLNGTSFGLGGTSGNGAGLTVPLVGNGSTIGVSNLGLGFGTNGSTGLSFGNHGLNSGVTSGMNFGTAVGLGMTGMQNFASNNNGAGFGRIV